MGREGVFDILALMILSGFIAGIDGQESIRTVQMLWPMNHQGTHSISCFPFQQTLFLNKPFHSLKWLRYERQTSDGQFVWNEIAGMTSQWRIQNIESRFHLDSRGILDMKNVTEADNGTQLRCDVFTWLNGSMNVESIHIMLLLETQEESHTCLPTNNTCPVVTNTTCSGKNNVTHPVNDKESEYHTCPTSNITCPVVIINSTCSGENNVTHPVNEKESEYHTCPTSNITCPVVIINSTCSGENNVTHPVNEKESEYHTCPTSNITCPVVIINSTCSGENNVTHPVNEKGNPFTSNDSLRWKISTFILLATTMVLLVLLGWVVCMYRHRNTSRNEGSDNVNHENATFVGGCSDGELKEILTI